MLEPLPDMGLIATEAVTLLVPTVEYDELGEPDYGEPEEIEVAGCIVQPGATSDLDAARPNGARVAFTVYMRDPGRDLRGCSVSLRGRAYRVVGDPRPSTRENVPGGRDLAVEVEAADG